MTAKEYYKSSRMVETRNWTLEMALNFAEEYTEALRIHDVVGRSEQLFCDEHTPKVKYDWQKGNCLTCSKKLEAK